MQGVGYRAWTEDAALERGLEGWVRNRRDGSVEAVFAGPAEAVADMIEACRRGPRGARVDAVEERDGGADDLRAAPPRASCSRCCRRREAPRSSAVASVAPEQRLELPPQRRVDLGHASPARPRSARLVTP